jgi:hypothetical protein
MAFELGSAIRLYNMMKAYTPYSKEESYRLYIVRQVYHELERKVTWPTKMKFDSVRATALCDVIDTVQASSMDLRNIRLELGKHTIKSLHV